MATSMSQENGLSDSERGWQISAERLPDVTKYIAMDNRVYMSITLTLDILQLLCTLIALAWVLPI